MPRLEAVSIFFAHEYFAIRGFENEKGNINGIFPVD